MPELNMTANQNRISDWMETSKKVAVQLLGKTNEISERLFGSGDLSHFFSLLSRFPYFDYRNILLLYAQFPRATDLASLNVWKSMSAGSEDVVKDNCKGKGINLLAPYTEINNEKPYLTWFTVKLYDISQTHITVNEQIKSPYITEKKQHIHTLAKAVRTFAQNEFGLEYIYADSDLHLKTGRSCYARENIIYIREKATELEQLSYIIEYIVHKNTNSGLPERMISYLGIAVRDCLFDIWNLPRQISYAPPYEEISFLDSKLQSVFLNLAQQWVRTIENIVLYEYMALKKEREGSYFEDRDILGEYTY